jgi:hypothetical protein
MQASLLGPRRCCRSDRGPLGNHCTHRIYVQVETTEMPYKTIYVRPGDERVFEAAKEFAERRRMSLSTLIVVALEKYMQDQ